MFGKKQMAAATKVRIDPFAPKQPATVTPPVAPQQPQSPPTDAKAAMMEFIKSQGLFEGIDMTAFATAVQRGDAAAAGAIFQTALANTVQVAIVGAQRISDASVQRAIAAATTNATGATTKAFALRELHTALPFAADKAYAPIVEGIFDKFIDNGNDMQTAISNTKAYFEQQARDMGQHFGLVEKPAGDTRNGTRGFSNAMGHVPDTQNYNTGDDETDVYDFVAALTSGQSTFEDMNASVQNVNVVNLQSQPGDGDSTQNNNSSQAA